MKVQEINELILNHLRIYGFHTSARILENELKTNPEIRVPNRPSKLYSNSGKFYIYLVLMQLNAQRTEREVPRNIAMEVLEMHSPKTAESQLKRGLSREFESNK